MRWRLVGVGLMSIVLGLSACDTKVVDITKIGTGGPGGTSGMKIDYQPQGGTLKVAETRQLDATCRETASNNIVTCPSLTWVSNRTQFVTVSTSGLLRCVAVGSAEVSVRTPSGANMAYTWNCVNPSVGLAASLMEIQAGQNSVLTWTTAHVTSCPDRWAIPFDPNWTGSAPSLNGTQQVSPTDTTDYFMRCEGPGGPVTANVRIKVLAPPPPPTITITPGSATIYACPAGGATTVTLNANMSVSWSSTSPGVASVNPTSGTQTTVTAHSAGQTTVRATGSQGQTRDVVIIVNPCPQVPTVISVTVSPKTLNLARSACPSVAPHTGQLTATVVVSGGASQSVTWSSSNTSVASVNSSGFVTANSPGQATITVRSVHNSSKFDTVEVVVLACPVSISLSPTSLRLAPSCPSVAPKTGQLTVIPSGVAVSWSSSDPAVASVNSSGLVTAHSPGSAVITANGSQGQQASAAVTVEICPISINPSSLTLAPSCPSVAPQTGQLSSSPSGVAVSWSSSNSSVASVSSSGVVTAHNPGTAVITATGPQGQTATSNVTVLNCPPTSISITPISLNLAPPSCPSVGSSTGQLTVLPAGTVVTWSSLNTSVATVTSSGQVTAVSAGTATIRATGPQGQVATATVTVQACPPPIIMFFSASPQSITVGQFSDLTWSSQNTISCSAVGGWSTSTATSGTARVFPTSTTEYVNRCTGTNGTVVEARVTVFVSPAPAVVSVDVQPPTQSCTVGQQATFGASVEVVNGASTDVIWSVSDPSVASIESQVNNQVTLKCWTAGTVVVTAKAAADMSKSDTGTLTVNALPPTGVQTIELTSSTFTVRVGNTLQAQAICRVDGQVSSCNPWFFSSEPSRLQVNPNTGLLTALAPGLVQICVQWSSTQSTPIACRNFTVTQ